MFSFCFFHLTLFGRDLFGMFAIFSIFAVLKILLLFLLSFRRPKEEESWKHSVAENVDATEILHRWRSSE